MADNFNAEVDTGNGGAIVFASDVIATIAGVAAAEVDGVASMSGTVVEGISEIMGKKSFTKGIKVEINESTVTAEVNLNVKYGYHIHEVCAAVQQAIKNSIETMTGLSVVSINVYVQAVEFDKPEKAAVNTESDKAK